MREQIEKKIGCSIEQFIKNIVESPIPNSEAEYPNPFSIFTYEEGEYIEEVAKTMFAA